MAGTQPRSHRTAPHMSDCLVYIAAVVECAQWCEIEFFELSNVAEANCTCI